MINALCLIATYIYPFIPALSIVFLLFVVLQIVYGHSFLFCRQYDNNIVR